MLCASGLVVYKADRVIKNQIIKLIQSSINNNPKSLYRVDIGDINTKIFLGNVSLNDVHLYPKIIDSTLKSKRVFTRIKIKKLRIQDLNWYRIILKDAKLATNKIEIISPQIDLYINNEGINSKPAKDFDLENLITQNNIDITFKDISVQNVKLSIFNSDDDKTKIFSIKDFYLKVKELSISPSTVKNASFPFSISDFTAGSGEIFYHLNNDYNFKIKNFQYNLKKDNLRLDNVQYTNFLTLKGYKKHFTDDSPYYNISVGEINLPFSKIDFAKPYYHFPVITIDDLNVRVFQSKKRKIRTPKIKPTLAESLEHINIPIRINQLQLSNCDFVYQFSESNDIDKIATISFNRSNITVYNFTNIDTVKAKSPFLKISAKSKFMDKANLTLEARYNLNSKKAEHQVNAQLTNFKLAQLNKTIAALAPISIKEGIAHSAKIKYKANKHEAKGTIDLYYTNLLIEVIKNEKKHKQYGVISFVANNILKKNNIPNTPKYKQGKIDCNPDPHKSILNYMWSCVKSGLKSSLSRSKKK